MKSYSQFLNESKYYEFIEFYNRELEDIKDKMDWIDGELADPSTQTWELKEWKNVLIDLLNREKEIDKIIKKLNRK